MGSDPRRKPQSQSTLTSSQPSAFVTSPEIIDHEAWFADSGISNHLTADPNQLAQHAPYGGKERLTIGDGKSLLIAHAGTSSLPSLSMHPTCFERSLCDSHYLVIKTRKDRVKLCNPTTRGEV